MRKKNQRFSRVRRPQRDHRINEDITEPSVRLITADGAQDLSTEQAKRRAAELGVDLVEIARQGDVPIVKIIDYGKFKFEKSKKEKENKKKQRVIQVKEIKMGPKIDTGDFDRKVRLAAEFLEEGDSVKVSMRFRGREMAHTGLGKEKLAQFAQNLSEDASLDKEPNLEGRIMSMVLRPKGKKPIKKEVQRAPAK